MFSAGISFFDKRTRKFEFRCAKENLAKFESRTWRMCDVVTGDETWIYYRKIESSGSWVAEGERPSTAVRRSPFEPKRMFCVFFMTNGPILIHQVPRGQSIDGCYYRTNCLESLVEQIKRKDPAGGLMASNCTLTTHALTRLRLLMIILPNNRSL